MINLAAKVTKLSMEENATTFKHPRSLSDTDGDNPSKLRKLNSSEGVKTTAEPLEPLSNQVKYGTENTYYFVELKIGITLWMNFAFCRYNI